MGGVPNGGGPEAATGQQWESCGLHVCCYHQRKHCTCTAHVLLLLHPAALMYASPPS